MSRLIFPRMRNI